MTLTQISARYVYDSWFAHEQRTRAYVGEWVKEQLPRRAGNPSAWYRCEFASGEAMEFIVGEEWEGWRDWSRPEGTYERLARNIVKKDGRIPEEVIQKIEALTIQLARGTHFPLFGEDPVILRKVWSGGRITVVEGHHRISAVCVAVMSGKKIVACVGYLAEP